MQEDTVTDVVIVGAGPSGLVLAIALAHYKVRSIILEKNVDISEDPRAIAMAGDTTRILELLGISRSEMEKISQLITAVNFHEETFSSTPFYSINLEADWLEQVLPPGTVILQNGLEKVLREKIQDSDYAELWLGVEVTSIEELEEGVRVQFQDGSAEQHVSGSFLVGADGKRGYVRKGYLEPKGIRQEVGVYAYEGSWIAANLHISLPTPDTHPNFPLWKLGYTPVELWDIFWPGGFHFCRHPTMPVATGRFGPKTDRYWRFEYELPSDFKCDDLKTHLREQIRPHLTLPGSRFSRNGLKQHGVVQFPEDCVQIIRCSQANFNNRVVNRWFHNRIILIGDAAHVFPPFGAQGMASGIRDAFGLSWRLSAILHQSRTLRQQQDRQQQEALLQSWARERRRGVDESSRRTEANGRLMLSKSRFSAFVLWIVNCIFDYAPSWRDSATRKQEKDTRGFAGVNGGFFLDGAKGLGDNEEEATGGGGKLAQVYVKTSSSESSSVLSDRLFWNGRASLTLLLLRRVSSQELSEIREIIEALTLPIGLLDKEIVELCEEHIESSSKADSLGRGTTLIHPSKEPALNGPVLLAHYNPDAFRKRFRPGVLSALIRPDFIIFSQAETQLQLRRQLKMAATALPGNAHLGAKL